MAQTYTGAIAGRVADETGNVVPNVSITVTDVRTLTRTKTVSNEVGDYIVSFLKPGDYSVSFAKDGFKEQTQTGLALQLNQQLRVDATLALGEVWEKVEVSATADQLNYTSPEIGHVVGARQLEDLPLVATNSRGRSLLLLSKLLPGVTSTSSNNSNINNFSFGGGRPVTNEILVDGLPTTNPSDQTYTLTPSPDSIEEFKVLTSPFSAEWGHTGGGVMILTSKSGTKDFHGYVYDYFRNRRLNARQVFSSTNLTKYVQNDPGIAVGGPVLIPKVYDGRNKTFFFFDFNVTLSSTGNVYQGLVPTDREKAGDFSQTTAGGNLVRVYDPQSATLNPDGTYARQPFSNNVIPSSRGDSVAKKILSYYPQATGNYNGDNYQVHPPQIRQVWQSIFRIDHNFGDSDKAFFRFGRYNPNAEAQPRIPNIANNDTQGGFRDSQAVISETHVFSPTVVNDFRMGFVQEVNYTIAGGASAADLSLPGVPLDSFPIVNVNQMLQLGSGNSNSDRNRSWVFSNALNVQRGRHTLKMGGDFRRQMYNFYDPGKLAGVYSFGSTFTSYPGSNGTGFGIADLFLGLPSSAQFNGTDYTYRLNINSAGMYLQDDFKVSSTLTLNLGMRWEFDGPYSEANGQFASFNPDLMNRSTGTLGEIEFAERNGAPRHFSPNIYHNFLPRIGFAWKILDKTVLRGGYGVYRLPSIGYAGYGPVSEYGVNQTFTSLDNITPVFQLAEGVPARSYNVDSNGLPNIPASLSNPSSNVTALERRSRTPYNQNWQIGVQRQFGGWIAEVDYAANKGTKLPIVVPLNQLRPEQFGPGNRQSQRLFPQYLNVNSLTNDGNSIYHSLQAKLEHRWNNGLLISASYTFSKLIDDVDGPARTNGKPIQNVYNLRAERGVGGYDVPQRFVTNYVYQVPFGRHGKFFTSTPFLRDLIDGWQVSGITEFQVGLPMSIAQSNNLGGYTSVQRPNQIAPAALDRGERSTERWFNTDAFVAAPQYVLGNAPRFPLHGPGIINTDLAVGRNFRIGERYNIQLQGQFFNAFNHPNFNAPNTTIGNKNFGVITGAQSARVTEILMRIYF